MAFLRPAGAVCSWAAMAESSLALALGASATGAAAGAAAGSAAGAATDVAAESAAGACPSAAKTCPTVNSNSNTTLPPSIHLFLIKSLLQVSLYTTRSCVPDGTGLTEVISGQESWRKKLNNSHEIIKKSSTCHTTASTVASLFRRLQPRNAGMPFLVSCINILFAIPGLQKKI